MAETKLIIKIIRGTLPVVDQDGSIIILGPGDILADSDPPLLSAERIQSLIEDGAASLDLSAPLLSPPLSNVDRFNARQAAESARGRSS